MVNYRVVLFIFCAFIIGIFLTDLPGNFISYSSIFSFAIFGLLFFGYKLLHTKDLEEENRLIEEKDENRDWLIKNGIEIKVDFNKCNIISNTSNLEVPVKSYSFGKADSRSIDGLYDPARTLEIKQVNQSRIQFNNNLSGEPVSFWSPIIEKDKITLHFLLANQKQTSIYYDPDDPGNFFYDLRFLEN